MKDKLRELAEQWRATAKRLPGGDYAVAHKVCAVELLAILDAEGDGGAVGEYVANVDKYGGVLWLNGPPVHGTKIYTHPERSGVVSDEDCREFLRKMPLSAAHTPIEMVRAALEHFAKGGRHER